MKCNFRTELNNCQLKNNISYRQRCDFEDCIFVRKRGGNNDDKKHF